MELFLSAREQVPIVKVFADHESALNGFCCLYEFFHHLLEFREINLAVPVGVHLVNDFSPHLIVVRKLTAEDLTHLLRRNAAATVAIEHFEAFFQVLLIEEVGLVDGGCGPLGEVQGAVSVHIGAFEEGSGFGGYLVGVHGRIRFLVRGNKLMQLNLAIPVNIELLKRLLQLHPLLFSRQVRRHESDRRLAQFSFRLKFKKRVIHNEEY